MVFKWASKVLDALSARAILQRLDKRKLQHELDVHRLFLLTSYQRQQGAVSAEDVAEQLAAQAERLQFEGTRAAVSSNLQSQLLSLSSTLHAILQQHGDPAPAAARLAQLAAQQAQRQQQAAQQQDAAARPGGRGLAFALGSAASAAMQETAAQQAGAAAAAAVAAGPAQPPSSIGPSPGSGSSSAGSSERAAGPQGCLTPVELSAAFREQAGFSLRVAPSSIPHLESGEGLWIEGRAGVGQIVALYPGSCYTPTQYRQIPGYPKVDRDNPFLIGRFDGVVLDAKPWGRGQQPGVGLWPTQAQNEAEAALALIEGRHPLALAHFANHPPVGSLPNVMVAAWDFRAPGDAPHLRAYMPNTLLKGPQDPLRGQPQQAAVEGVSPDETVPGLALVATRELENEEVFLNYRLSPHVARPEWYCPVDEEEDRRRWA